MSAGELPTPAAGWSAGPSDRPWVSNLYYGRVGMVAEVWWMYEPLHPTVTMTRIVDRLNLPAGECAPSPTPTWSMKAIETSDNSIPRHWQSYYLDGQEVLAIVWFKRPGSYAGWHQRILDALNAGRGLPAVEIPALHERAA